MRLFILVMITLPTFLGCNDHASSLQNPINLVATASTQVKSASELHAEGLKFYNEQKYQEAIDAWLKEAELVPQDPNTVNNIGIAFRSSGDSESAIKYHKKAIVLDPDFGRAYYSLGLAYLELKDYGNAVVSLLKAIDKGYSGASVFYSLGLSYKHLKRYDLAAVNFRKTTELDDRYEGVHYQLGICYKEMGLEKFEMARAELKKEIEFHPRWKILAEIAIFEMEIQTGVKKPELFYSLGNAYLIYQRQDEGYAAFKKTIEIDPLFPCAHLQLAKILENRGDLMGAKEEYEKEFENHPGSSEALDGLKALSSVIEKESDRDLLSAEYSDFRLVKFPQKAIVISKDAGLYDNSFVKIDSLAKGAKVIVEGIHDFLGSRAALGKMEAHAFNYELMYRAGDKLIMARDVVLESSLSKPVYVSKVRRFKIIRNPVSFYSGDELFSPHSISFFVLANEDGDFAVLDIGKDYSHELSDFISISPDDEFIFTETSGMVYSADGNLLWRPAGESRYSSASWGKDMLYMRGVGYDDTVYALDLKKFHRRKFIEFKEGSPIGEDPEGLDLLWPKVIVEGELVRARFTRLDSNPPDRNKPCRKIEVVTNASGHQLNKKEEWSYCEGY